ncbi:hypothetical protein FA15DRAFT_333171 [Coprinopsis marcescibilis]|uniref:Uncharacterized protein n=1 Tax=Coprinopsis marcescibilis TaxID=230819 RepID=A0A5C3KYD2_COPMA|nr:hypothetical protein FA15DRAFT_333171 [Coprinopsis marcescibilis]
MANGLFNAPPLSLVPISSFSTSPRAHSSPQPLDADFDNLSDGSDFSLLGADSATPSVVSFTSSLSANSSMPPTAAQSPHRGASIRNPDNENERPEQQSIRTAAIMSLLSRAASRRTREGGESSGSDPESSQATHPPIAVKEADLGGLSDAPSQGSHQASLIVNAGSKPPSSHKPATLYSRQAQLLIARLQAPILAPTMSSTSTITSSLPSAVSPIFDVEQSMASLELTSSSETEVDIGFDTPIASSPILTPHVAQSPSSSLYESTATVTPKLSLQIETRPVLRSAWTTESVSVADMPLPPSPPLSAPYPAPGVASTPFSLETPRRMSQNLSEPNVARDSPPPTLLAASSEPAIPGTPPWRQMTHEQERAFRYPPLIGHGRPFGQVLPKTAGFIDPYRVQLEPSTPSDDGANSDIYGPTTFDTVGGPYPYEFLPTEQLSAFDTNGHQLARVNFPASSEHGSTAPTSPFAPTLSAVDKGKGKEVVPAASTSQQVTSVPETATGAERPRLVRCVTISENSSSDPQSSTILAKSTAPLK